MTAQYYKHINLVLMVCSADSEFTLTKLSKWYSEAKTYIDDSKVTYALCITKSDLPEKDREVKRTEIENFARHCGIHQNHIFEVSARTGDKVQHMIKALCNAVIESYQNDQHLNESLVPETSEASSLILSSSSAGVVGFVGHGYTIQPGSKSCCTCCVVL